MIAFKITEILTKIPNFSIKLAPLWTHRGRIVHKKHSALTNWSATRTSQLQMIKNDKANQLFFNSTSKNNSRPAPGSGDDAGNSIYNTVFIVVDIIVLVFKFWFTIIESILALFIPRAEMNVNGHSVLITGAGHGIGKQLALQYSKLGAKIICWDINEENNNKTVEEIKKSGGSAFGYVCNVTKREDVMELARRNRLEHGFISIIINNAGIMPTHSLLEHKEQETRLMFDLNVLANFWVLQAFLPEMIERNEGNIVALSSMAGLFGVRNLVPYCGTKFAVRGYMTALAEELRSQNPQTNIKLTTIFPYMIDTGLVKNPSIRFQKFFHMIPPTTAAATIIKAQRQGLEEAAIPRYYVAIEKLSRLFPKKSMRLVSDFISANVDSDLK